MIDGGFPLRFVPSNEKQVRQCRCSFLGPFSRPKKFTVTPMRTPRWAFARLLQLFKTVWTLQHGVQKPIPLLYMCPESEYSTCVFTTADVSKTKRFENTMYAYPTQCYGHTSQPCVIEGYKSFICLCSVLLPLTIPSMNLSKTTTHSLMEPKREHYKSMSGALGAPIRNHVALVVLKQLPTLR